MSLITQASVVSLDMKSAQHVPYVSALKAGEDLLSAAPCYVGSDGKVYMSISTQTTVSGVADYVGFTADVIASGSPVTLFKTGARFNYASSMTPGAYLFIGATAGRLDNAKVASGDDPVAVAISASDILVVK